MNRVESFSQLGEMRRAAVGQACHAHLLLWIALIALSVFGCAGRAPFVPPAFYEYPEAALRVLAKNSPGGQAVTTAARIEIRHQDKRYLLRVAVMMNRPDLLRVESIPLLGPPDFFLSVANGELRVFLPVKNAFYRGLATPHNVSRFFPVSVPVADLVPLLMGVPPGGADQTTAYRGMQEEELYRMDHYPSGRRTRSLWIEPEAGRLSRFQRFTDQGTVLYTADLTEHVRVGDDYLPRKVTIRGGDMTTLTVRQDDPRHITADPESFPLAIPAGTIPILLNP